VQKAGIAAARHEFKLYVRQNGGCTGEKRTF
jgi:hypothetical protein